MSNYVGNIEIYDEGQSLGWKRKVGMDFYENISDASIPVTSVADMVTKVLSRIGSQKERVQLIFRGVGTINYQSVGAGTIDPSRERSFQVDSKGELNPAAKMWLPHLAGRISGIYLLGIGESDNGNGENFPLLLAISKIFKGVSIHTHYGAGMTVFIDGNPTHRVTSLRSDAERKKLRESLSKLDKK